MCKQNCSFVYLSDFSACAFITEAAHLSLFIVVTRSHVPHFHFSPIKNPPSIATGGFWNLCMFTLLVSQSLHDTKAILMAFFNVNLNHMLLHSEVHLFISLAWKSLNLQYCYTLFIILCQHLFDNLDTFFVLWRRAWDSNSRNLAVRQFSRLQA